MNVANGTALLTEHQRVIKTLKEAAIVNDEMSRMRDILVDVLVEECEQGGNETLNEVLRRATAIEDELFFDPNFSDARNGSQ